MACPTCDHTMQKPPPEMAFWCPRCGTLKIGQGDGHVTVDRPTHRDDLAWCAQNVAAYVIAQHIDFPAEIIRAAERVLKLSKETT